MRSHLSGEEHDRVVATLAVTRELHALGVLQQAHVLRIEGRPERVRMHRLPPLVVRRLVAMLAILRRRKGTRFDEGVAFDLCIAGQERLPLPKR